MWREIWASRVPIRPLKGLLMFFASYTVINSLELAKIRSKIEKNPDFWSAFRKSEQFLKMSKIVGPIWAAISPYHTFYTFLWTRNCWNHWPALKRIFSAPDLHRKCANFWWNLSIFLPIFESYLAYKRSNTSQIPTCFLIHALASIGAMYACSIQNIRPFIVKFFENPKNKGKISEICRK